MTKPHYIALDGPDGCGKTTQLDMLAECLQANGVDFQRIREPGQTALGLEIRGILLNGSADKILTRPEACLFAGDRSQTALSVTIPALRAGKWIISDRSFLTTTVYQGYGRKAVSELKAQAAPVADKLPSLSDIPTVEELESLHQFSIGEVRPDLQIVFDIPAEVGLARKGKQLLKGVEDRFESMGEPFQQGVREGFAAEQKKRNNVRILDASGTKYEVHADVMATINAHTGLNLVPLTERADELDRA